MDKCDIIIPVWNQPAITKDCIDSLVRRTPSSARLIIVDNASDDETRHYLESLKGSIPLAVILIRNEKNAGFIKAVNQAITSSDAPYVCILNNDTLVTDGWLDTMIGVAASRVDIGVVNPSSNNLGQKPSDGEVLELYAKKLKAEGLSFVEMGACIGFCMLIKREVIAKIGLFDEIYGMGNFEDTDFSRRAVREGYKCVRSCAAYVYHRENTSFSVLASYDRDFKRNKEIFEFRWGKPKRIAYVLDSCDSNTLKRLDQDFLLAARGGNWVWYFTKDTVSFSPHSNIKPVKLSTKNYYLNSTFRILKKKKKFDQIFVGSVNFAKVLERLSFIHKARVAYY